jgi:hypothetical protein
METSVNLLSIFTAPVDTSSYYIAGYVVFFTVMTLYLTSLLIRDRNLRREFELLVSLEKEE